LEATSFRSTKRRSLAEQQLVLRRKQQRPGNSQRLFGGVAGQGRAAEFDSAADPDSRFVSDSGLRVGAALEVRVESAEQKARQLFGAGSAEVLRGRGADRSWGSKVSAPECRACWLFGAGGVAILRGRGAESFEAVES